MAVSFLLGGELYEHWARLAACFNFYLDFVIEAHSVFPVYFERRQAVGTIVFIF